MQKTTLQKTAPEEQGLGDSLDRELPSDSPEDIDIETKITGGPGGEGPPIDGGG